MPRNTINSQRTRDDVRNTQTTEETDSSTETQQNTVNTMSTNGNNSHRKDPKIEKFDGKTIKIEQFLPVFEFYFDELNDRDKVRKLGEYLSADAFSYFATDIITDPDITWIIAKDKLEQRFGHSEIGPMTAAVRRRLTKGETIKDYFDDKCRHLRRTKVDESYMAELLTEGLPESYRQYFYGKRLKTVGEWLQMSQDIEADITRHRPTQPSTRSHFTRDDKQRPNTNKNFKSGPSKDKRRPPFACRHCRDIGLTEWHWHADCPNRDKKPEGSPAGSTSNTQNIPADNSTNSSLFVKCLTTSPQGCSSILIPAKIRNFELSALVDTGSDLNIMPLHVANHLRLHIDRRNAKVLTMARGRTSTIGTVMFPLTISRVTHTIKAVVLSGFKYTLLLSLPACSLFRLIVDTTSLRATVKESNPQCLLIRGETKTMKHRSPPRTDQRKSEAGDIKPINYSSPQPKSLLQTIQTQVTESQPDISQLKKYEQLFASDSTDLGRIEIEYHRIILTDDIPTAQRPHRQSISAATEVARQVKELKAKGLIRESVSPYAAPVTLPDKKDGTKRLAIDFRHLNAKTVSDRTPLPLIADVIDQSIAFKGRTFSQNSTSPQGIGKYPFTRTIFPRPHS